MKGKYVRGGEKVVVVTIILIVILVIVNIVIFLKYINYKSRLAAYMRYYIERGIEEPTAEKLSEYQQWAIEMMVKDFFRLR